MDQYNGYLDINSWVFLIFQKAVFSINLGLLFSDREIPCSKNHFTELDRFQQKYILSHNSKLTLEEKQMCTSFKFEI